MNANHYRLLTRLLSQPAVPFREQQVVNLIRDTLERAGVPHFPDPAGNLVIGVSSPQAYRSLLKRRSKEPVRLFIAHMDHPGFHGIQWLTPSRLLVKWHGGSPVRHLRGARVWLAGDTGAIATGGIVRAELLPSRHAIDTAEIQLDIPLPEPIPATALYGAFNFRSPVWRQGQRLYTRAADDLVGVFAIMATTLALFRDRHQPRPPFLGLLTRAEEVGFIGAIKHFELGWLAKGQRPVVTISLETSRQLSNARIGKGPVVRLGDRRSVFDPGYLRILSEVAEQKLPGRHQRRVMDGGTCEATAALAWGLRPIGISVPLGNYHNQGFDGGPDCSGKNGPAPEYVHIDDIDGLLTLCRGLMQSGLNWEDPWRAQRTRLHQNLRGYRSLLRTKLA
jgi:putative aminopeptidase FrvX